MKKLLILTSMLILFIAVNAQPEDCEIPGKTIQWIADYCIYEVESGDLLDEKVQTCLEKNRGYTVKDTCENKIKYKMKICKHLAGMGYYNGNAEICFSDMKFMSSTVKNNIIDQTNSQGVNKETRRFGSLSKPYHFLLFFLAVWISITLLMSIIGGWRLLSKAYRADFSFDGKKLKMKSGGMRWGTNYGACLTIGANREGLYLAVFPIFRIGHPPLFVPWNDISTEDRKQPIFFPTVKFIFRKCPNVHLVFSKKLADRIFRMREESQRGTII